MFNPGAPRLDHRLHDRAFGRVAVGIYDYAEVVSFQHRLQRESELIESGWGLVDKYFAVARDGERDRLAMLQRFGVALGQVDRDGVEALHRERREHEGDEKKEHHVDHRNDFDPAVTKIARSS